MRGILLAGGTGTRLYPATRIMNKSLLPIYNKPLVYYPLSALMLAGIREVLVISTPEDLRRFQLLFDDGSRWGMRFHYEEQEEPRGLADAYVVGARFVDSEPSALVLGDNMFYGWGMSERLRRAAQLTSGAQIFAHRVPDPERYGVVSFDRSGHVQSLEEKPKRPRSNYAVVGLYFYDGRATEFAASLEPSARGEIEITDLNRMYLERGELAVDLLGRGSAWLDAGTADAMLEAARFVEIVESQQGLLIASPEEIAWRSGWIDDADFEAQAASMPDSEYGKRLLDLLERDREGAEPADFLQISRDVQRGKVGDEAFLGPRGE